jgi:hypothetical protein
MLVGMSELYVLGSDFRTPVLTDSVAAWSRWHREHPEASQVGLDRIRLGRAEYNVDTKFWGSELNSARALNPRAPSSLFRTTAFEAHGRQLLFQVQCATWAEAEAQHAEVIAKVRQRAIELISAAMPEEICILQT